MGFVISRCVNDMCKHSCSDVFAVRKIFLRYLLNMKKKYFFDIY